MARILVVDDDHSIRQVLAISLAARGNAVRLAEDGETALRILQEWPPDLIITDLSMPRMGGLSLCLAVRSLSNVPIIMLSVEGEEAVKAQAFANGADDYITKPFRMAELMAGIRSALGRGSPMWKCPA